MARMVTISEIKIHRAHADKKKHNTSCTMTIRLTYKAIRYLKGRQRLDIQELSIKKIMFATNPHKPAKLGEITTKRQQRDLGFSENSGGGDLRRQKVKRQHQKTARLIAG